MATSEDRVIDALEDLGDDEFETFRRQLRQASNYPEGQMPLKKAHLENKNRSSVADMMVQSYPEHYNEIMVKILRKIARNDLAKRIEDVKDVQESRKHADSSTRLINDQEGAISEEIRYKTKMCIGGGLLCAPIGVILLVVGISTDYWLQYEERGMNTYQGLWKQLRCDGTRCFTVDTPSEYAKALIAMGVVLLLLGMVCFIGFLIGMNSYVQNSRTSKAAGIMFLFSSVTVAVSMIVYSSVVATNLDMMLNITGTGLWSFSWSYLLGWTASVFILWAGIFTICAHRIIE